MRSDFDSRPDSHQLADLKNQTEELERKLADARVLLERELAQSGWGRLPAPGRSPENGLWPVEGMPAESDGSVLWDPYGEPEPEPDPAYGWAGEHDWADAREDRTEALVSQGRRSARYRRIPRGYKVGIAVAVGVVLVTVATGIFFNGRASWPASVATIRPTPTGPARTRTWSRSPASSISPARRRPARSSGSSRSSPAAATRTSATRSPAAGPGAHHASPGRRGGLVAEPAPPV